MVIRRLDTALLKSNMESNTYFVWVSFIDMKLYRVETESKEDAGRTGVNKSINEKFYKARFLRYYDSPIFAAVCKDSEIGSSALDLYRFEDGGKKEEIKEVKKLQDAEFLLRSLFRMVREDIKDLNDLKEKIGIVMTEMANER